MFPLLGVAGGDVPLFKVDEDEILEGWLLAAASSGVSSILSNAEVIIESP